MNGALTVSTLFVCIYNCGPQCWLTEKLRPKKFALLQRRISSALINAKNKFDAAYQLKELYFVNAPNRGDIFGVSVPGGVMQFDPYR